MLTTRIDEIDDGIYRISTALPPTPDLPPGFTFNQFLIVDDEPLLFHTGMRKLFPQIRDTVARVMPIARLRWVSYSHHESDEDGSMLEWMQNAPQAAPLCGRVNAICGADDSSDRTPRIVADGETIVLGKKRVQWLATPHVPHGWDAGMLFEQTTRTLFCGDLFTQAGSEHAPTTTSDIVGPSEQMRAMMEYYSNPASAAATIDRLASCEPALLAAMHGTAYRGDGAAALRALAGSLRGE